MITSNTEILMDGQPCKLEAVPPGSEIILLELAKDGKTVLKLHFRSRP